MKAKWSNLEDTVDMVYINNGVQYMITIIFVGSYKDHHVIGAIEKEKNKSSGQAA